MKICSFNTLKYNLSNGLSSHRDQLNVIQKMIEVENPDVAILLEMPNPRATVESSNISIMQHLHMFEQWLSNVAGYRFQRKIDDDLCVWVVSKKQLIPLLLLGSETLAGAASRIFKIPSAEPFAKKVFTNSDYLDCIASVMCAQQRDPDDDKKPRYSHPAFGYNPPHGKDRSIVLGVVDDEVYEKSGSSKVNCRRVLPIIATHAKCLFNNDRFGRILSTLCRAAVVKKGIVVGDFNFGMESDKEDRKIEESDERLAKELQPGTLDRFVKLPLGLANKEPPFPTCNQISFPYAPLNIDGVFASKAIDMKVGGPDSVFADNAEDQESSKDFTLSAMTPCEEFPSDHRWVTFNVDKEMMIEVPIRSNAAAGARQSIMDSTLGHGDFIDARYVCYQWSQSHPELFGLFDKPIFVARPPLPEEEEKTATVDANGNIVTASSKTGTMRPSDTTTGRTRSPRSRSPPLSPASPQQQRTKSPAGTPTSSPSSSSAPGLCKFGDRCRRPVCHFQHPSDTANNNNKDQQQQQQPETPRVAATVTTTLEQQQQQQLPKPIPNTTATTSHHHPASSTSYTLLSQQVPPRPVVHNNTGLGLSDDPP